MAHGRNYLINSGHRGGPRRPKFFRFRCTAPNGAVQEKTVPCEEQIKKPISLWYKHNDQLYLHTVVDEENMPDWANNYEFGSATRK